MALEFVLSQLCTWYRMFSEAMGLMNNKAATSWTVQSRLPRVLPCPQTFCLLTWIWIPSSAMRDNMKPKEITFILNPGCLLCSTASIQLSCVEHCCFMERMPLTPHTPHGYQQSPWPKPHYSIQTVSAGLLQMAKLNQQIPAGRLSFFHSR